MSRGELGRVLPADTYRVNGFAVPLSITLPDGWRPQEFTENNIFVANTTDNGLLNVSLLVLDKVYADPCTAAGGPHPIGSGVDALVTALSNMAGFEVDDLRDVSVGGAAGKAFTLTNSVDAESCVGGDPWLWIGTYEKDGSDELVRTIRGAVDPFWIVDVAGTTVLIAPGIRDTSASSLAAADSMVDAISFPDATPVAPSFAPDATRIAFVSDCEVAGEIYTMNADGSNMVNITNSSFPDSNPTWSPDRTRIAFASIRDNNSDIYSMNADGSDVLRLTDGPAEEGGPAWSPDGASIAFERNGGIYTMNADGSEAVRLSDDGFSPAWSPDGTRIAFMRRGAKLDDIYSMNADGSGVVRLTNVDGWQFSPAWSPDGSKLAFSSGLGIGTHEIHTMNADGSNVVRLTNRAPAVGPAWSPDGARIAFSRSDGIYSMNADGSDLIRLTNNMGCVEAAAW